MTAPTALGSGTAHLDTITNSPPAASQLPVDSGKHGTHGKGSHVTLADLTMPDTGAALVLPIANEMNVLGFLLL